MRTQAKKALSKNVLWALIPGVGILLATAATAGEAGKRFSGSATVGMQYDSNVSIDDIDQVTNLGDASTEIEAGLSYRLPLSGKTEMQFGYDFSQSLHKKFDQFDLQTHLASAELSHDFGRATTSLTYRYIHARLGGEGFLTIQQLAPSISANISEKVMVRGTFTYADKTFAGRPLRDSVQNALALDAYYFVKGTDTYVSGGYKRVREAAGDRQFSYDADEFKLKLVKRLQLGHHKTTADLQLQTEDRRYVGNNPVISAPRHDRRNVITLGLETQLTDRVFAGAEFSSGDYGSNLASADYRQQVALLKIGTKF